VTKSCPYCAETIQEAAVVCRFCRTNLQTGETVSAPDAAPSYGRPQVQATEVDPAMRFVLPVGRSALSIAAGYLGLCSLIACIAPVAVVVSIMAIRELKRNPELLGWGRAIFGLVMGSIGTIILILFGVAVAMGK
jgi:heme A synthase